MSPAPPPWCMAHALPHLLSGGWLGADGGEPASLPCCDRGLVLLGGQSLEEAY